MEHSLVEKPYTFCKSLADNKKKKFILLLVTAVLLIVVSNAAFAWKSRITWNPDPLVLESITPGEEVTYIVSLTNTDHK